MLESLIFMVLPFIGIIGFIISIIILFIGIIKKSKKLKNTGLIFLMIPLFCYGLIQILYKIVIPNFNNNISKDFVGVYSIDKINSIKFLKRNKLYNKEQFLILKENGIYVFDTIPGVGLWKTGKWNTEGVDGFFNFYNNKDRLIGRGMAFGSGNNCGLKFDFFPNPKDYKKRENLTFKKSNTQLND